MIFRLLKSYVLNAKDAFGNILAEPAVIASATVAVSALGCAPVSSCRSHPDQVDGHPYLALWTKRGAARIVREVVDELEIGGINWTIERENDGILVYDCSVTGMMDFGKGLYDRRNA